MLGAATTRGSRERLTVLRHVCLIDTQFSRIHVFQAPPVSPIQDFSAFVTGSRLFGEVNMPIHDLCSLITRHSNLQLAKIISTETYCERVGRIKHRFLLVELQGPQEETLWLRLDRQAERVSFLNFLIGSSVAPSKDTVSSLDYRMTLAFNEQRLGTNGCSP